MQCPFNKQIRFHFVFQTEDDKETSTPFGLQRAKQMNEYMFGEIYRLAGRRNIAVCFPLTVLCFSFFYKHIPV